MSILNRLNFTWVHAAIGLLILFALLFPFYAHIFDIDAVGYITVARNYAHANWQDAINGYWSPLNSWLMVPFIKLGFNDVFCFKIANVFFGIGALYQTDKMLTQFKWKGAHKMSVLLTTMVMVLYYASVQLAADMLFVWIFLWYVNEVLKDRLHSCKWSNIKLGTIAAIAFFAKTYAGVFFILHISFVHLFYYPIIQKKKWNISLFFYAFIIWAPLIMGWMWLLYEKYHIVTFGYSGPLNWSWALVGGQPNYPQFFYYPPYQEATSRWVDPFFSQGEIYSPFQSKALAWRALKLFFYNVKNGIIASLWISFLMPILLIGYLKIRKASSEVNALLAIILLFPLFYLLIFMEERYLWPLSILVLVVGVMMLQTLRYTNKWVWMLLYFSFIVGPIIRMAQSVNRDIEVTKMVEIIKSKNIQGYFTGADSGEWMHKAAFLTGNQYLPMAQNFISWEAIEAECLKNKIAAISIEMKGIQAAKDFLSSSFFKKYELNATQLPISGSYIWLVQFK